jgi:hypothetical protein
MADTISTARHPVVRYIIGDQVGDVFGKGDAGQYDGLTLTVEAADDDDAQAMLEAIQYHDRALHLMRQAHAVMRQCGWQLAPGAEADGDGVLELATAEIEEAFGTFLSGRKPMTERYGRRKISKMLKEWNRLREAVRGGDIERIQDAFDDCEEWVDFAFGKSGGGDE